MPFEQFGSAPLFGLLEHTFQGQRRAFAPQLNLLARQPNLVTTSVILAAINTELVLEHAPFADRLVPHGVACERAVALEDIAPVHLVSDLHAGNFRYDLRSRKLLEFLRRLGAEYEAEGEWNDHCCSQGICRSDHSSSLQAGVDGLVRYSPLSFANTLSSLCSR